MDEEKIIAKLDSMESQLREILSRKSEPRENLMAWRVAALKRIEDGVEQIDELTEFIETEVMTIEQAQQIANEGVTQLFPVEQFEHDNSPHNNQMRELINQLKTIRNILMGS